MARLPQDVLSHRLVVLGGSEEYLMRRALRKLLEEAVADPFDLQAMVADEVAPAEWVGAASTVPFLSPRRVVVVRNLLRAGSPDDVFPVGFKAAKDLPDTALLVLVADDEPGDADKQRRLERLGKGWMQWAKSVGGLALDFAVEPGQVARALNEEARAVGKTFTGKASQLLIEMCGGSLSRALEEFEKLVVYLGEAPQIREADVRAVVVPSREWNVYRLVDAALSGRTAQALEQLQILVASPEKAESAAFQRIFPTLSRQLRLVWQARACVEARCSPEDAPPALQGAFLDKPNLRTERDIARNAALRLARNASFSQIAACLRALAEADAAIKGLAPTTSTYEALEIMVLRMASAARATR